MFAELKFNGTAKCLHSKGKSDLIATTQGIFFI
jgi:hypothetical protein